MSFAAPATASVWGMMGEVDVRATTQGVVRHVRNMILLVLLSAHTARGLLMLLKKLSYFWCCYLGVPTGSTRVRDSVRLRLVGCRRCQHRG